MDLTQLILVLAVGSLTIVLTLVGFQVYLIFRELHRSLKKANKVLDDIGTASSSMSRQIVNFGDFVASAKTTFELAKVLLNKQEKEGGPIKTLETTVAELPAKTAKALTPRRFFHHPPKAS